MSKTYSAGIVTAYGAAKRAGYQGTYEDFCRQQAQYAESAAAVEQAKTTAVNAASTATAKAGEAATAATAAQTAKTQTVAAALQALTDIGTARTAAISAVQTKGQIQTENATAQAQAAAQSATTASTKASEASASATSAGQSATNAAASATSAATSASAAQAVLESIPEDYSDLSEDVDQLKADLVDVSNAIIVSDEIITMDNTLYTDVGELTVGKYYRIGITANIAGTYTVHVAKAPSAGAVVGDPIFSNVFFDQNKTKYIIYKPLESGIHYVRFSAYNVIWTCAVAELFDTTYIEKNTVQFHSDETLYLDSNTLSPTSPVTMSEGWSGDYTNGFAHTKGNTGSMYFGGGTTANARYIVEFDATGVSDSNLFVRIGNSAKVDVYNGTNHFIIGFVSDSGNLMFTPTSSFAGTLTNITLRKILTTGGTTFTISKKTINHQQTENDISGFWNVAIGAENTQDSNVNGSRNIGVGFGSQHLLESGTRNIGIGTFSMPFVKDGDRNIAIGADSLYSTRNHSHAHAEDCVAIGYRAMSDGTNVKYNVAIGTNAMKESTDEATYNVCVGAGAGTFANYGLTAIGYNACARSYTKADASVFVGRNSGVDNAGATAQSPKNVSNVIAIGDGVLAKNSNEARFGNANNVIYLAGKKITFNDDHTVTWEDDV